LCGGQQYERIFKPKQSVVGFPWQHLTALYCHVAQQYRLNQLVRFYGKNI
jgi:hypothetical protein